MRSVPVILSIVVIACISVTLYIGLRPTGRLQVQTPQVSQAQIEVVQGEFTDATPADAVQMGDEIFLLRQVEQKGDSVLYRLVGFSGSTHFFWPGDLVRERAKLIKKGDTPEYNLAVRQFVWTMIHPPF